MRHLRKAELCSERSKIPNRRKENSNTLKTPLRITAARYMARHAYFKAVQRIGRMQSSDEYEDQSTTNSWLPHRVSDNSGLRSQS